MLKSTFTFRALLIPFLIIVLIVVPVCIVVKNWPIDLAKISGLYIYLTVALLFTLIWLVFGELRTKIISVTIDHQYIEKKNYLGWYQKYHFKDFDGFETSILVSKGASHEYLYLVKNNRKIIKISEAYHKNYNELKNRISLHSKDLGEVQFSYIDELKEIFK